jgi:hypothetical protein
MTLRMIYPSNNINKGEAIEFIPDGTMVLSNEDFASVVEYAGTLNLRRTQLKKAPKLNEQRSSNW